MNCTIAAAAMATALSATQVSNDARFSQCARRCKDHGVLGFGAQFDTRTINGV
jgi:hypothetical protein